MRWRQRENLKTLKQEMLADADTRAEYDALADEYAIARELIAARAGLSQAAIWNSLKPLPNINCCGWLLTPPAGCGKYLSSGFSAENIKQTGYYEHPLIYPLKKPHMLIE